MITGSRLMRSLCAVAFVLALGGTAQAEEDTPQVDYMLRCQGCHVGDGSGYPGKVPDLRVSMPALLATVEGREFLLRVPGASLSVLDNAQLARVYNWMVGAFLPDGAPPGFVPFDAAEVARARTRPLADVQAVRIPLAAAAGIPAVY